MLPSYIEAEAVILEVFEASGMYQTYRDNQKFRE